MADLYRIAITDRPEIASVQGTLIKVIKKSNNNLRRVIHTLDAGKFMKGVLGDPLPGNVDRWELVLKLPTGSAANRVDSYIVQVVVLDRKDRIIDRFVRRRPKPEAAVS